MKYFAYGSNMDSDRMRERGVNFTSRKKAILKNWELVFNKVSSKNPMEGYANIRPKKESLVEGILYEIEDSDIEKLDYYEGYPFHYNREKVILCIENSEQIEAITYVANPGKVKEGLKPSRNYLEYLLNAQDILSKDYYKKLEEWETLD